MNDTLNTLLYVLNRYKYYILYENINFRIHMKILWCGMECDGSLLSFNTSQGSIQINMNTLNSINFISNSEIDTITLNLMDDTTIKLLKAN